LKQLIKNSFYAAFILAIGIFKSNGQDLSELLMKEAVKIDNIDSLDCNIYKILAHYRIIMVGEIHGTNEPIGLVENLVELFNKNGDSVQVGFEIEPKQMKAFLKQKTEGNIIKSDFFQSPSGDGRASFAWYKTIANLNANKMVKIFFFDYNFNPFAQTNRDSIMYVNIKSQIKKKRTWRTITICGGIHNRIKPHEEEQKMGWYLINDKELNFKDSMCSLIHEFESGETLWNKFNPMPSAYTKIPYDKYIFFYPKSMNEPYHGIYFTRYLTKSESAISK
jgi:hypothetical protein